MTEKWERWNKEEYTILKKHYPDMPREDLMRLLPGRTWGAIYHIAEQQEVHRNRRNIPKSKAQKEALHAKLSIARSNRTKQPFAGKHHSTPPFAGKRHSAEARMRISVSNLYARGHSIVDIAQRKGIAKEKVVSIIEGREERRMSKEAETKKEAEIKTKSMEPFIRANPHTGQREPVSIENYLNTKHKPKK